MSKISLPSGRSISQYAGGKPEAVLGGSHAQALCYVEDSAKDILYLHRMLEAAPKAPQDMNLRELFDHVAIVNDAIRAALLTHPGMTPMRQEPTPRQCASCGGYSHAPFKKCVNCSAVLG